MYAVFPSPVNATFLNETAAVNTTLLTYSIALVEVRSDHTHDASVGIQPIYLIGHQRFRTEVCMDDRIREHLGKKDRRTIQPPITAGKIESGNIREGRADGRTHTTSVKKSLPLGCILISFKELNCRPKKLSNRTVVLCGGFGLTSTIEGGRGPRPEVMRSRLPRKGPVPPFVIWTVGGRSSYI